MKTLLIGSAALLASAAAIAQVAPDPEPRAKAERVHNRAEVQSKVAEHFARLDTNRDGSLTQTEADAGRKTIGAQGAERRKERREDRREKAFERIDGNRDGAISRSEWDARENQRQQRVAAQDRNGDGRRDARRKRGGGMHGLGGQMFGKADANKDGRVTLQEAQTAALRHFDMADANRDGQVTRDERRQARQRMRAQHRG